MSDREDYFKSIQPTQPKAKNLFSDPTELSELIKDIDAFETAHPQLEYNTFQNPDADREIFEKHDRNGDAEKTKTAPKHEPENFTMEFSKLASLIKKAKKSPKNHSQIKEENQVNLYNDIDELMKISDPDEFLKWLGVCFPNKMKKPTKNRFDDTSKE